MRQKIRKKIAHLTLFVLMMFTKAYAMNNDWWGNITAPTAPSASLYNPPWYDDLEFSVAAGPSWLNEANTHLTISSFERDRNIVNSVNGQSAWKLGVGYYIFIDWFPIQSVFEQYLIELNLYGANGTINGNVWQYQLPQFNNFSFRAPFNSTRLMLDVKPYLFRAYGFSPYLILGIGAAWNKISYHETVIADDVDDSALSLNSGSTRTNLAGEVGVGFSVKFNCWLDLTAEYIYAYLGHVSPSNNPNDGILLASSPNFLLRTQSVLLGLSFKL